jgi:hypothetical protein
MLTVFFFSFMHSFAGLAAQASRAAMLFPRAYPKTPKSGKKSASANSGLYMLASLKAWNLLIACGSRLSAD